MKDKVEEFAELAKEWKKATEIYSLIADKVEHPVQRKILLMGKEVVPLILAELERDVDHWFYALRMLTGEDPVPEEDAGRGMKMRGY